VTIRHIVRLCDVIVVLIVVDAMTWYLQRQVSTELANCRLGRKRMSWSNTFAHLSEASVAKKKV